MANQAYNGQPINIQFDYEGEGTMDSKLVQLSESAAKDPTTWLKNGIYRIGNGQPVFTQDGKALIYIGRNGNATDIADDTKWIKFTSTADVQAMIANGISASMQPFHIVDADISATPTDNVEAGNAYIVGTSFTIAASDILTGVERTTEVGDILIAVDVEEETEENGETVTNTVTKFAVMQTNIDTNALPIVGQSMALPSGASGYGNMVYAQDSNGKTILMPSGYSHTDFMRLMKDFLGIGSPYAAFSMGNGSSLSANAKGGLLGLLMRWAPDKQDLGGFSEGRVTSAHHFLDDCEKNLLLSMVSTGIVVGNDEDDFIAAVQAMDTRVGNYSPAYSWESPMEFVMNFRLATGSESLAANFFGFTKSLPYVRGLWEKGRTYGSKGVIRFKNYDLAGTLSSPCVEYTYDMDAKVLSYQKFIEVTVNS